jgi:formate dehydrogenase major subunit
MLQFRPGADVAMLNAMMHVIVEEGSTTNSISAAFTETSRPLKEHLAQFPPEKMAERLRHRRRDAARRCPHFATAEGGMIFWGMGVSQHIHGTDNSRCLISLALITGHVGRPARGCIRCAARTTCRARRTPG